MDYENAKAERDFRNNPPEGAPGQDDEGWGDIFDSEPTGSSSAEQPGELYSNIDSNLAIQNASAQQNTGMQQQNMQQKSTEDYLFDATVMAGKGVWQYFKALWLSVKDNTESDWHVLGVRITKVSGIVVIIGVLFTIVEKFRQTGNTPIDLVIGSLMSMFVGIALCMMCDKKEEEPQSEEAQESIPEEDSSWKDVLSDWDGDQSDSIEDEIQESSWDEEESDWGDFLEDDSFIEDSSNSVESDEFDVNDALDNVVEIQQGTQTRQYLFETFTRVLPMMNPTFSDMKQITSDENEFYDFEELLRSAAYQVGTKEECIPELESIMENDFIYRLTCSRPAGIKEQLIADELATAYSRDANNMLMYDGVYATVETSVGVFSINLFKGSPVDGGKPVIISLGDVYGKISEWVLNPRIKMPFVWGVNEFGKVLNCDLKDCQSIMISGEPDGGKSWKGQSILAQLCMFNSPKEVHFYIFDPKDNASDYRYFSEVVPHVRYFCGNQSKICSEFEKVVNYAETERTKMLRDAGGLQKIEEYNDKYPENKMPYMYIVIDELMSLMSFLSSNDKDEYTRFKELMRTVVSRMRYIGVRVILFPHRIVDNVIDKNTYSLISSRAVVRQLNIDELKNSMNVTQKEFPYSLVNKGDMAIKTKDVANGKVVYCHAEVLTSSNEGNKKLYDFIGGVWKKLEPDCECIEIAGSMGGFIGGKDVNEKLKRSSNPVRDNTQGEDSFEYHGFNDGSSVNDLDLSEEDAENSLDVDESFWDTF